MYNLAGYLILEPKLLDCIYCAVPIIINILFHFDTAPGGYLAAACLLRAMHGLEGYGFVGPILYCDGPDVVRRRPARYVDRLLLLPA